MKRDLPAGLETALSASHASFGLFFYIDWPGGPGRFWSGVGSRVWDAEEWTGAGELVQIDKVAESLQKADIGLELRLNYLDDTIRNEIVTADTEDIVGNDATLYLANMVAGQVQSASPIFPGFVDSIEIEDSGETGALVVRLASELARLRRPRWFSLSDAHQQYLFPDDLGLEFASRMDEPILWGRKPTTPRYIPRWNPERDNSW